jgi:hypothetical protein
MASKGLDHSYLKLTSKSSEDTYDVDFFLRAQRKKTFLNCPLLLSKVSERQRAVFKLILEPTEKVVIHVVEKSDS